MKPHLLTNRAFAKEMLEMALDANTPSADLCQWEQSCRAESIARELAECGAYQLRQVPKAWHRLPPEVQQHFRQAAEQAIRQLDLSFTDKVMEAAVKETADWLNGPFQHPPVSLEEIAREVIHRYVALLSTPVVPS